jgi:hypothetical protein
MDCTARRKPSLNVSSVEQEEELVVSYFDHMTGLGCTGAVEASDRHWASNRGSATAGQSASEYLYEIAG